MSANALAAGCWIDSAPLPLPYPAVDLLVFADGSLWLAGPEVSVRSGPLPPGGRANISQVLEDPPAGTTHIVPMVE